MKCMISLALLCFMGAFATATSKQFESTDDLDSSLCFVVKNFEVKNAMTKMFYARRSTPQRRDFRVTTNLNFIVYLSNIRREDDTGKVQLDMETALVSPKGHCRFVKRSPGNFNGIHLGRKSSCRPKSGGRQAIFSPRALLMTAFGPNFGEEDIERLITYASNDGSQWDIQFDQHRECPSFDTLEA